MKRQPYYKSISGHRFGRLTAVERTSGHKWLCKCECGSTSEISAYSLRGGLTRSCGCILRKHGLSGTKTYRTWDAMVRRATDPNDPRAKNYVLRGIGVCSEWRKFENFLADMGEAPAGLTLERIDNDKGYFPGNCRWATPAEQNRNKRPPRDLPIGVRPSDNGKKWVAYIKHNRRMHYLGTHPNMEGAISARAAAEERLWGKRQTNLIVRSPR